MITSQQSPTAAGLDSVKSFFTKSEATYATPYVNAEAFRQLYGQTHISVYRFIYSLHGGSSEAVEDLTAETFERAWKARHRFRVEMGTGADDAGDAAAGWLITIARNLVFDARRKQKRQPPSLELDEATLTWHVETEQQLLQNEARAVLLSTLQTLADDEREMVTLRYILGWRVQRIAEHFELKENTASVKIKRALEKLRRAWPDEDEPQPLREENGTRNDAEKRVSEGK